MQLGITTSNTQRRHPAARNPDSSRYLGKKLCSMQKTMLQELCELMSQTAWGRNVLDFGTNSKKVSIYGFEGSDFGGVGLAGAEG